MQDRYVALAEDAFRFLTDSQVPGSYLVDVIPWRTSVILQPETVSYGSLHSETCPWLVSWRRIQGCSKERSRNVDCSTDGAVQRNESETGIVTRITLKSND